LALKMGAPLALKMGAPLALKMGAPLALNSHAPKVQTIAAKGNALDTHTQTFKKGLLQQMFV
jgi:hypothetical protein